MGGKLKMWRVRFTPGWESLQRFSIMKNHPVAPYSVITRDGYATEEEARAAIWEFCPNPEFHFEYSVEEY